MTNDWNSKQNTNVIVGYFQDAEDAQNAIYELRDEGFGPDQVGAAFHSPGSPASSSSDSSAATSAAHPQTAGKLERDRVSSLSGGKDVAHSVSPGVITSGSGATGARSDDSVVTPAGLATGSGTGTTGASRPGPIPGADVPRSIGGETHRFDPIESSASSANAFPSTGGFTDEKTSTTKKSGWWDDLKHFFGGSTSGKKDSHSSSTGVATDSSLNFGTGEGHLGVAQPAPTATATDGGLYSEPGRDYSSDAEYESSELTGSFHGMGVSEDRSRYLSRQLSQGGAIVTVKAEGRAAEAEQILERNHARVRHEASTTAEAGSNEGDVLTDQSPGQNRAVLFGEVLRVHRSRFSEGTGTNERKAS